MQLLQGRDGRDMAPWTASARTSKPGGPLKSSCVTLNEPCNLSECQFIFNYTDVTVSTPSRGQVSLKIKRHLLFPDASARTLYPSACQRVGGGMGPLRQGTCLVHLHTPNPGHERPQFNWEAWVQVLSCFLTSLSLFYFHQKRRTIMVPGGLTKSVCITLAWHLEVQSAQCT